jgi:hypothetical protein
MKQTTGSMLSKLRSKIWRWAVRQLMSEPKKDSDAVPYCDFDALCFQIRACDVILVEGRTRISDVIRLVTQSPWTHAGLYIGRVHDIQHPETRELVQAHYQGDPNEPLVVESLLGKGTVINPLSNYRQAHLRICRPSGLAPQDAQEVVRFAISHVGFRYNIRQILDLARFLFPWTILPRAWRSSLFQHHAGDLTKEVCSSMLAQAFSAVHFPITPLLHKEDDGSLKLYRRNFLLTVPRDFDFSPYFEIVKYPYFGSHDLSYYRRLPWDEQGVYSTGRDGRVYIPDAPKPARRWRRGDAKPPANDSEAPPSAENTSAVANLHGKKKG